MLHLRLFGPITVEVNGELLPAVRSRRGLYLLVLLALRANREVSRLWLAGTLWPESDDSKGLETLKRTLTDLRKALGPAKELLVSPTKHTLLLRLPADQVDVLAFDEALRQDTPESLERAVALYRAPLLEECYEEWVRSEQEPRHAAYFSAVERLVGARRSHGPGALAALVPLLREAAARDRLRESTHGLLMEALAAAGNPQVAAEVYRELRSALLRESAKPSSELTALYNQIRAAASAPVPPSPPPEPVRGNASAHYSLPRPLTVLIGREQEQLAIEECLHNACLVTLTGAGGIGKTRLALETAWVQQKQRPHGACFVDLAPLRDPGHLTRVCAAALGLQETDTQPILDALLEHLRPRALLLVLDNCEHVVDACAELVGLLLRECPKLQVLTTSRQPLGITGEVVWRVPVLEVPPQEGLLEEVIERYAALRLFFERLRAVQPALTLNPVVIQAAIEICRRLDGIPLALELAAARGKSLSVEQIAERLEDRFRLLTGGSRNALPRQQTLRALIDWSYDILPEKEQQLMARLSIFHDSYSLEAAEAICADGHQLESAEILDLLEQLVDKSIVLMKESADGQTRYWMLETIREYSRLKLEAEVWSPLSERYQSWYLQLAQDTEPKLLGDEKHHWLSRLDDEYYNLRYAISLSVAERHLELCATLCRYWYHRGYWTEGRERLQEALARPDAPTCSPTRAKALKGAGNMARSQGDYLAAAAHFEECLAMYRALDDLVGSATILNNLATVSLDLGSYDKARTLYEESLALCRALGEHSGIARALHNLGMIANEQGDNVRALALYGESLALSRSLGDRYQQANTLHNLGNVAIDQGDYQKARQQIEQALAIDRDLKMEAGVASSLNDLGRIELLLGGYDAAQLRLEESLALSQSLGDHRGTTIALGSLGLVALAQGEREQARTLLRQSLQLGQGRLLIGPLLAMAHLAALEERYEHAALLYGGTNQVREGMQSVYPPLERRIYEDDYELLSERLGDATFQRAYTQGGALSLEALLTLAGA